MVLIEIHILEIKSILLLTYLLIPWSRVLLEKLASLQLVKKFPALSLYYYILEIVEARTFL